MSVQVFWIFHWFKIWYFYRSYRYPKKGRGVCLNLEISKALLGTLKVSSCQVREETSHISKFIGKSENLFVSSLACGSLHFLALPPSTLYYTDSISPQNCRRKSGRAYPSFLGHHLVPTTGDQLYGYTENLIYRFRNKNARSYVSTWLDHITQYLVKHYSLYKEYLYKDIFRLD